MFFDVLIIDQEINSNQDIIKKLDNSLNNINIHSFSSHEKVTSSLLNINLAIIDIENEQNFDFLKKLQKKYENIHIILTIKEHKNLEKAYDLNIFDFIHKPLFFDKILFKIKHYQIINKKENELLKQKEFSKAIIENINTPIFLTDGENIIFSNKAFLNILNLSSIKQLEDTYTKVYEIFKKDENYLNCDDDWLEKLKNNNNLKVIIEVDKKDKIFKIQSSILNSNKNVLIFLDDITHEIEYKNELIKLLYTDNLTKLPNRAKLIDQLQHNEIDIDSIAIFDIKSFKEINDFFGNKIGDYILVEIANLILENIRKYDNLYLYKFPADIYCLTAFGVKKEFFLDIIKKIVNEIYKQVFYFEQYEIDARVIAGVSFSQKNNKLITADLALQAAKKDNKEYLVFYDKLDNLQEYENNMLWAKKLKNALAKDNIIIYYQPLINNKTMQIDKYECLVRMVDEDKIISPFFFLDISKKSNQYTKITRIVIDKAFKKFSNSNLDFSVNISYEDIEDNSFLNYVKMKLKEYNVKNQVVFEILEDENIKNYDILIHFIEEVKKLGCKIAIDDFGSGYSNFEHILKMNIDYLKIDASIIKNIANDKNSYKITKTIIEFAKSLNIKTIAEFVENENIFNIIKELGADFSQGYYFSAPIDTPDINSTKDYNE